MSHSFVIRRFRLTPSQAQDVSALAAARHVPEDAIVQEALEMMLRAAAGSDSDWSLASDEVLRDVWDNAEDARYDNWRVMYGVQPR